MFFICLAQSLPLPDGEGQLNPFQDQAKFHYFVHYGASAFNIIKFLNNGRLIAFILLIHAMTCLDFSLLLNGF